MKDKSIAVVKCDFHDHTGSWSGEWLRLCREYGLTHELIDWREIDAFEKLQRHDVVLWHYSHYSDSEMKFAHSIMIALKASGCTVFPDRADASHFDDKVAQAYLFDSLDIPTPRNYVLYSREAVDAWINEIGSFPIVAKLRSGSGASNVVLLRDRLQLTRYADKMFGRGLASKPSPFLKIRSNISSSRSWQDLFARAKRAPEFFFSLSQASAKDRERGYVYLQEFFKDVAFDLKVVVVGDRLSFIGRKTRRDDFRASGGGDLFYDRSVITADLIHASFKAADALASNCMGFDIIYDQHSGKPFIIEASYGFSHTSLMKAGGFYDRNARWHDEPMNAPELVMLNMIQKASL